MVFKKFKAIGKKRKCKQLGEKAQSLLKQQYWCAATSEGDGDLVSEKWLSILDYITYVHGCHGERFTTCLHVPWWTDTK